MPVPDPTPDPAPDPDPTPDPAPDPTPDPDPAPDPKLADAGQKALAAERDARKAAEKVAKDLQTKLDKAAREAMSDLDRKVAEARDEGKAEVQAENNARILASTIRERAAGRLNDPGDALLHLDTADLIGADGTVDEAAVTARLDALVAAKPYLAANSKPGHPNVPLGPQGTAPVVTLDEQIAEAQKAGNTRLAVSLINSKLPGAPGST